MRYRTLCAGLLASVAAGAGTAVAADIAVRPAPPMAAPIAAPAYISEWAGFYVGIHGGGGWGHTSFDPQEFETLDLQTVPVDTSPHGGVFGFQFGHNWQFGPVVGGLEIDFSGADIHDSSTFFDPAAGAAGAFDNQDFKIDSLASARGRLGYLIFPNWLIFGTAGIGWAHTRLTVFEPIGTETNTTFENEFGWVAGAGLEYKIFEHWLLRGEWLHYDFGRVSHPIGIGPEEDNVNARTTVDVARAALSYKF